MKSYHFKLMDGPGEYNSERGQPDSEDQKLYVLPHIRSLDQGKVQQCCRTWVT
jgi:hypothetical protein